MLPLIQKNINIDNTKLNKIKNDISFDLVYHTMIRCILHDDPDTYMIIISDELLSCFVFSYIHFCCLYIVFL